MIEIVCIFIFEKFHRESFRNFGLGYYVSYGGDTDHILFVIIRLSFDNTPVSNFSGAV